MHKLLFVLFRLVSLMPGSFLVDVVLFVSKHLGQSCCSMPVNLLMVLVENSLPFGCLVILE